MWRLYCLPGRLLTGPNGRSHAIVSTIVWLSAALIIGGFLLGVPRSTVTHQADQPAASYDAAGTAPPQPSPSPVAVSRTVASTATSVAEKKLPALAQQLLTSPQSVEKVYQVMLAAAASGKPERWQVAELAGSAIPNGPGADGCAIVRVSIDGIDQQSRPDRLCLVNIPFQQP